MRLALFDTGATSSVSGHTKCHCYHTRARQRRAKARLRLFRGWGGTEIGGKITHERTRRRSL